MHQTSCNVSSEQDTQRNAFRVDPNRVHELKESSETNNGNDQNCANRAHSGPSAPQDVFMHPKERGFSSPLPMGTQLAVENRI
jgi:hypothetical protein